MAPAVTALECTHDKRKIFAAYGNRIISYDCQSETSVAQGVIELESSYMAVVEDMCFGSSDKAMWAVTSKGSCCEVDVRTGMRCLRALENKGVGYTSICHSGDYLVLADRQGYIRTYDVRHTQGGALRSLQPIAASVQPFWTVAIDRQQRILAGGCNDARVYLWAFNDGEPEPCQRPLEAHTARVTKVRWSRNGFASASADGLVNFYAPNGNVYARRHTLRRENGCVYDVRYSTDGNYCVTVSSAPSIALWRIGENKEPVVEFPSKHGVMACALNDADPCRSK